MCFKDLHEARGVGFSGPMPISFPDIAAWSALNGTRLKAWELSAIRALDNRLLYGQRVTATDGKASLFADLKRMAMKNKRRQGKLTNG